MTLDDIKHLTSPACEQLLSKPGNFELHAEATFDIINAITGGSFATDIEFLPDTAWLRPVVAWIIEYVSARKISAGSDAYWSQTAKNYDNALKILAGHRIQKIRTAAKAAAGKIENLYENE